MTRATHLDRHVALADRLWRGEPPELWEAAQRLLDLGTERHEALHVLMETLDEAGPDEDDIAAALCDLPPDRLTARDLHPIQPWPHVTGTGAGPTVTLASP